MGRRNSGILNVKQDFDFKTLMKGTLDLTTLYNEEVPLHVLTHGQRVGIIASQIANELNLSKAEKFDISMASFCHDFGKSRIDRNIINKEGILTAEEFNEMKKHAFFSSEIVKLDDNFSRYSEIVLFHHEYMDGTGYYGLKNNEIPFLSRIIVVSDIFDALCSDRVYRKAYPIHEALIKMEYEKQRYDPEVYKAFLNVFNNKFDSYEEVLSKLELQKE